MAMQFQGDHICPRCGIKYPWQVTVLGKNEVVLNPVLKNVKNCDQIYPTNRYNIQLECPKCYHKEFIERTSESSNSRWRG